MLFSLFSLTFLKDLVCTAAETFWLQNAISQSEVKTQIIFSPEWTYKALLWVSAPRDFLLKRVNVMLVYVGCHGYTETWMRSVWACCCAAEFCLPLISAWEEWRERWGGGWGGCPCRALIWLCCTSMGMCRCTSEDKALWMMWCKRKIFVFKSLDLNNSLESLDAAHVHFMLIDPVFFKKCCLILVCWEFQVDRCSLTAQKWDTR